MIPGIRKLVTAPTVEPVSTAEAKTHLRVTSSAEDSYIATLIKAARLHVELTVLKRALVTQTWDLVLDAFPASSEIEIPYPPLQSITSISYITEAGETLTYAASNYLVDAESEPGRIKLKRTSSWPGDTLREISGVRIRFVAGYGLAAAVPEWAKQAILLYVGDLYENREDTLIAQGVTAIPLPYGAKSLLFPHRMELA